MIYFSYFHHLEEKNSTRKISLMKVSTIEYHSSGTAFS